MSNPLNIKNFYKNQDDDWNSFVAVENKRTNTEEGDFFDAIAKLDLSWISWDNNSWDNNENKEIKEEASEEKKESILNRNIDFSKIVKKETTWEEDTNKEKDKEEKKEEITEDKEDNEEDIDLYTERKKEVWILSRMFKKREDESKKNEGNWEGGNLNVGPVPPTQQANNNPSTQPQPQPIKIPPSQPSQPFQQQEETRRQVSPDGIVLSPLPTINPQINPANPQERGGGQPIQPINTNNPTNGAERPIAIPPTQSQGDLRMREQWVQNNPANEERPFRLSWNGEWSNQWINGEAVRPINLQPLSREWIPWQGFNRGPLQWGSQQWLSQQWGPQQWLQQQWIPNRSRELGREQTWDRPSWIRERMNSGEAKPISLGSFANRWETQEQQEPLVQPRWIQRDWENQAPAPRPTLSPSPNIPQNLWGLNNSKDWVDDGRINPELLKWMWGLPSAQENKPLQEVNFNGSKDEQATKPLEVERQVSNWWTKWIWVVSFLILLPSLYLLTTTFYNVGLTFFNNPVFNSFLPFMSGILSFISVIAILFAPMWRVRSPLWFFINRMGLLSEDLGKWERTKSAIYTDIFINTIFILFLLASIVFFIKWFISIDWQFTSIINAVFRLFVIYAVLLFSTFITQMIIVNDKGTSSEQAKALKRNVYALGLILWVIWILSVAPYVLDIVITTLMKNDILAKIFEFLGYENSKIIPSELPVVK